MYPPKHYVNSHSRTRSMLPPRVFFLAGIGILCFLFVLEAQFYVPRGNQGAARNKDIEVIGPRPYFVGSVDERLKEVQNETLGARILGRSIMMKS